MMVKRTENQVWGIYLIKDLFNYSLIEHLLCASGSWNKQGACPPEAQNLVKQTDKKGTNKQICTTVSDRDKSGEDITSLQ